MKIKGVFLLITVFLFQCGLSAQSGQRSSYKTLENYAQFSSLQEKPLVRKYGEAQAVKVVYQLSNQKLYFINGRLYDYHYSFCSKFLSWRGDMEYFNKHNYSTNSNQEFLLANLNFYPYLGKYVLEFSVANEMVSEQVLQLYNEVKKSVFFKKDFFLLVNNQQTRSLKVQMPSGVQFISNDDLYKNQNYQPLHIAKGYGVLKKVSVNDLKNATISSKDILLINGSPNVLPVTAGVITTDLQSPLSHISLLGKNRDIPIMSLKTAWEDSVLNSLVGKPVKLVVNQNNHIVVPISKEFLAKSLKKPKKRFRIKKDIRSKGLIDAKDLGRIDISMVGGKAANFGELANINFKGSAKTPEGAFAIPFYYYHKHMVESGAQGILDTLLSHRDRYSASETKQILKSIRMMIKLHPLDSQLFKEVENKIIMELGIEKVRFRSSTNAEDIRGFNGAGLYASKSGKPKSAKKPIDKAIKKVWASLWYDRAFNEREVFGISQKDVAMGILVHRAFPNEKANGVAITKNLYREKYPGFVISVQKGEESVVAPREGVTCDHMITYLKGDFSFNDQPVSIDWVSESSLTGGKQVLSDEEILQLTFALRRIKKYYYTRLSFFRGADYYEFGLDVEFKFVGEKRELYIKQVREFN